MTSLLSSQTYRILKYYLNFFFWGGGGSGMRGEGVSPSKLSNIGITIFMVKSSNLKSLLESLFYVSL